MSPGKFENMYNIDQCSLFIVGNNIYMIDRTTMEISFKLFCAILGAFYTCIYYMYCIVLYTHLHV